MTKRDHSASESSLFSLDLTGEGYVPEPEEESPDCAINVKETQVKRDPLSEKVETIEIPCATYIGPSSVLRSALSKEQAELYRNTVLDVRRYLYNSIVCEDFCVSCEVMKNDAAKEEHVSDVSDEQSDASPTEGIGSTEGGSVECTVSPSPSATIIDEGIHGSRKAQRVHSSVQIPSSSQQSCDNGGKCTSTEKVVTAKGGGDINSGSIVLTGLCTKLAPDESDRTNGSVHNVDATVHDSIKLTVNIKKLSNIVTDIEHVQMCSSVPFPRLFRLSRENLSSGLVAAGRRYFLASESVKGQLHSTGHKAFLAHLYRRKRSICFFCGFLKCPRTVNSKQQCRSMRCHRCSFTHQWGRNRCQDKGSMVQYYLRSNDWRNKRNNPWFTVRDNIKRALRCFYCGKIGDASFRCRKMACPHAAATLEYRCLELLGKPRLDRLVRERPEMFKHLRDPNYVFK